MVLELPQEVYPSTQKKVLEVQKLSTFGMLDQRSTTIPVQQRDISIQYILLRK